MKASIKVVVVLLAQLTFCLSAHAQMPPGAGGGCTNCPPDTNSYVPPAYVPGLKMNISPPDGTNFLLSLLEADSAGKYDIYFVTNLISATWNDIRQGTNGQTNFTLPISASQNGFFRVARTDQAVADAAGISFYFLNGFVNSNIAMAVVEGGVAAATAILVDSTNFTGATWLPFSSIPLLDIGTNEGTHEVWFGFRGTNGVVYWMSDTITLDKTPPSIVITNPAFSTTSRPVIQIQGYSTEPLSSIYFDVTNAAGSLTNQQGFVTAQNFDANTFNSTTNWFQCFDIELTNGANTITVRAADLAGNVTTTNVIVTLDFSGDTNPPVITVIWPQDGVQISGTNFTLRGVLDDETAQITAQTMDTNGVTNIVSGVVERNGTFWLEDLPLNPGTNTVTVTAMDAAGNPSVTNLILFQSDVTLTIDVVPDGQLNQSVTTVSGTVSDPSYDVWVNGVQATVNGSGHWATNNVPVYGNGTATFDAIAYPPGQTPNLRIKMNSNSGQSPVQKSQPQEQSPMIYVGDYNDNWDHQIPAEDGNSHSALEYHAEISNDGHFLYQGTISAGEIWPFDGDGHIWWESSGNWSDGIMVTTRKSGYLENHDYDVSGTETNSAGIMSGPTCSSPDIYHYYAKINYDWEYGEHYTRNAKTTLKLRTGGKSGISRENLFRISANASAYGKPSWVGWLNYFDVWFDTPKSNIASKSIRVLGKNVSKDGDLFIVLPDNATLDMGATAPGRHYSLNVGAAKHKLAIFANGNPLADDRVRAGANFCVGQGVVFSPYFYPGLPSGTVSSKTVKWNLTGQFVTAWTQWSGLYGGKYYYGSKDYYRDNSTLTLENSRAWWTKGGNPAPEQKTATLGIMLEFNNGQNAFLKRAGLFTMYQPSIDFHQLGQAAVYIDYIGVAIALRIGKNIGSGQLTDTMGFAADIYSDVKFPGEVITTQLINRNASIDGISFDSTDGALWLDGNETYPNSHDNVIRQQPTAQTCYGQSVYSDGPGISIQIASWASINDTFKTYFRFRPGGSDSIWVTLGRADWNWFGNVEYTGLNPLDPNSWTLTSSGIVGPNFSPTDEPPQWHLTFHPF